MKNKNKTNFPRCFFCDEKLCLDSDCDAYEVYPIEYDEQDSTIISMYHCPNCGREYEILDPPKELQEKEYSKYWKK